MLTRRLLLAAPLLMAARPELSLEAVDSARREAFLAWPKGAVFTCPATRARLVAVLAMGRQAEPFQIAIVGFGLDTGLGPQDWLAFVDSRARLLALEPRSQHGGMLETRAAMLPDRMHIALERLAAVHTTIRQREAWTDYLRLEEGLLVNAPQRQALPGTWQNALAAPRAAMAALLSPPPLGVPAQVIDLARNAFAPHAPAS